MSSSSWFSRALQRASRALTDSKPRARRKPPKLRLEWLEDRLAPALNWIPQGPSPATGNGNTDLPPNDEISGAVEAIVAHPTNPAIVYVGAVNGGVWRTANATATSPIWTPLTDNLPSQSIGAMALDPSDATGQTLLVGTGRRSSFGSVGDDEVGLYYTTNGGTSWTQFNDTALVNREFVAVTARGDTLLAASSSNRFFRSTDRGVTWTNIAGTNGLGSGTFSDLVADPVNATRYYTAILGVGLFRSDDSGGTWTNVTSGITGIGTSTDNIKIAVHNNSGTNVVYVGVVNSSVLNGVFRSTNQGAAWTAMDRPVVHNGGQGSLHFAIAAHPTNANLVFISGDRTAGSPFTAPIVRGDASLASGSQFVSIVEGNAGGTAPHADSRVLVFDANGDLYDGGDGGIARRATPTNNTGVWSSANGNLQISEIHDIAYNSISNTILTGTQDNGTHQQTLANGTTWVSILSGDGGDVAVDNVSLAASNQAIRYYSFQVLGGFRREVLDANNTVISTTQLAGISNAQFVTPIELNAINPTRLLIGGFSALFESMDQGTSNTNIGGPGANENAMVYGGRSGGVANPELIYVGSGNQVFRRTTAGGAITATSALPSGAGGITDVAIDPDEFNTVFAIDTNQVFLSTNGGTAWSDVTGNLRSISSLDFRTIEFVPIPGDPFLAIGTRSGVFFAKQSTGYTAWSRLGTDMPDVLVYDLDYNLTDDVLVAGTLGRGAFMLSRVTATEDFGDAPDTFGTLLASNGPRHTGAGPTLGALRDSEVDANTPLNGTGDDATDLDDEDGVTFGLLFRGETGTATVNVQGGAGFLNAWVDINANGTFDTGEQIATNQAVVVGDNTVTFAIPADVTLGNRFARFRLTSATVASPSPQGLLPDGEVEDYQIAFVVVNVTLVGGNLSFVDPADRTDGLTVTRAGANLRFNDPVNAVVGGPGTTQIDLNTVEVAVAAVTGTFQISTSGGNDTVTLNLTGGFFPPGGVSYLGGAGNDTLMIQGGSASGPAVPAISFDGGDGNDTFQVVGSATLASLTFLGGIGDDRLIVDTALTIPAGGQLSFNGGADNDSIQAGSANVPTLAFVGGAGNDSISVTGALAATSFSFDGGAGMDTVTIGGGLTGNALVFNGGTEDDTLSAGSATLASLMVNGDAGNDSVLLGATTISTLFSYSGGAGDDKLIFSGILTIPASGQLLFDGGSDNDRFELRQASISKLSFLGQAGNDVFSLQGNLFVPAGGNFTFDGGDGSDRLELAGAITSAGGKLSFQGGTGTDTVASIGLAAHTWTVLTDTVTLDNLLTTAGIENVQGGEGPDTFVFRPGSRFAGTLDGGRGNDAVNLMALPTASISFATTGATDGFTVNVLGATRGSVLNINRAIGSRSRANSVVGLHAASQWSLGGGGGSYSSSGFTLSFTGFAALRGGRSADNINVTAGFPTGVIFDGGLGVDGVRVNGTVGNDMFSVGFSSVTVNNQVFTYQRVESMEVMGGSGADTFMSPALSFAVGLINLRGEGGNDTFNMTPSQSAVLRVFGGAGFDTLRVRRGNAAFSGPKPLPTARSGRITFESRLPIEFAEIESIVGIRSQFLP